MSIRAVVFDIGGVLEITPRLGVTEAWEQQLQLRPGELGERLGNVWAAGAIGQISESEVHQRIGQLMGMSDALVSAFMDDMWREYLGTLNVELTEFFRSLRPAYQTAIISNSFVGAREREQAHYQFGDLCDCIIYSHEVGMSKPDPRIYLLACERLGLKPHEVIFLDDYQAAVDGACAVSMHGILFTNNDQAIADIQACIAAQTA